MRRGQQRATFGAAWRERHPEPPPDDGYHDPYDDDWDLDDEDDGEEEEWTGAQERVPDPDHEWPTGCFFWAPIPWTGKRRGPRRGRRYWHPTSRWLAKHPATWPEGWVEIGATVDDEDEVAG